MAVLPTLSSRDSFFANSFSVCASRRLALFRRFHRLAGVYWLFRHDGHRNGTRPERLPSTPSRKPTD